MVARFKDSQNPEEEQKLSLKRKIYFQYFEYDMQLSILFEK